MATSIVYTDQTPTEDGSALAADTLNTAVVAQGYVIEGGLVDTSITGNSIPGVGLDLMMMDTAAVVVNSSVITGPPTTTYVFVPARTEPFQFSADNYVDLFVTETGPTSTGSYTVTQVVPPGDPAPPLDTAALRLCVVTMSATGFLSQQQLASPCPVNQEMVTVDTQELAAWDPIPPTASLRENMDRLRFQLGAIYARVPGVGEWLGAGTLAPWDTSQPLVLQPMVPWSMRGVANGVAELDGTGRLPDVELPLIANFTQVISGDVTTGTLEATTASIGTLSATTATIPTLVGAVSIGSVSTNSLSTPPGGTITGTHLTAGTDINTPVLYVDTILPHTPGAADCNRVINVTNATLVVQCQVNAGSFFSPGLATFGSLNLQTPGTATIASTLGVGGQATFGSAGNSPGILVYGPLTVDDGPGPASVKVGGNRYTDAHADLMVAGDAIVQGNVSVRTTFNVSSSTTLQDVQCSTLSITGIFSGPIVLDGDLTLQPAGALGSGSLRLRRLIYDQDSGPSAYTTTSAGSSLLSATDRATNTDNYGYLDYFTGAAAFSGDQFSVTYGSSNHAAHPGVFLMLSTQGGTRIPTPAEIGHVYISSSTNTGFTVAFSASPPAGVHYRFIYHVVE